VSALLSLVAGYHDRLLSKYLDPSLQLPPRPFSPSASVSGKIRTTSLPLLPPSSDHTRYTQYYTLTSTLYRRASRLLATLGHVELLLEMIARRKRGDRARWKVVLMLELMK
jgi:peroxin-16